MGATSYFWSGRRRKRRSRQASPRPRRRCVGAANRLCLCSIWPTLWPARLSRPPLSRRQRRAATKAGAPAVEAFTPARADLHHALTGGPPTELRYVALTNRGVLAIRRGQWETAGADLKQAIALQPDNFAAYLNLAHAWKGAKR